MPHPFRALPLKRTLNRKHDQRMASNASLFRATKNWLVLGEAGFEPTQKTSNRFTVCRFKPLGHSPLPAPPKSVPEEESIRFYNIEFKQLIVINLGIATVHIRFLWSSDFVPLLLVESLNVPLPYGLQALRHLRVNPSTMDILYMSLWSFDSRVGCFDRCQGRGGRDQRSVRRSTAMAFSRGFELFS